MLALVILRTCFRGIENECGKVKYDTEASATEIKLDDKQAKQAVDITPCDTVSFEDIDNTKGKLTAVFMAAIPTRLNKATIRRA